MITRQRATAEAPDITSLQLLLDVLEHGSIRGAALAFGLSQPSVTARLRRLEVQLGVPLLVRTATGSRATTEGALVAEWAAQVVTASNQLMSAVRSLAHDGGALRVASSLTIAEYLLPRALQVLRRVAPSVRVELQVANSTAVAARVVAGQAELGFVESPDEFPALNHTTVAHDELLVVVGNGHPWVSRRNPLRPDELVTAKWVLRERGSGTLEYFSRALRDLGVAVPKAQLEVSSTAALKAAVGQGSEATVLSRLAVAGELEAGLLHAVPVAGLPLDRPLRAIWQRGMTPTPVGKRLLAVLEAG